MRRDRGLLPVIGAGTLTAACGVGLLATSGWLITRASQRPAVLSLSIAIGAVQAFSLGRGLARYVERIAVHGLSLRLLGRVRLHLFDVAVPLVPGAVGGHGTGGVLSGFVSDTELVAQGYARGTTAAVDVSTSIVLGTALAALLDPLLGLVMLGGALAVVVVGAALVHWGLPVEQRAAAERAQLASAVVDAVRSAPELVAYGREDLVEEALEQVRRRAAHAAARRALVGGLGRAGTIVAAGGAVVALVGAGMAATDSHHLSGVALAVVIFAALAVMDQCTSLPAVFAGNNAARAASARLKGLERLTPAVDEPATDHSAGAAPGSAELVGAETATPGGARILKGVSLRVGEGERVALVGPSGSGKTSAVHALLHFVACSRGRACLGGVDVSTMTREGIATLAGWLPDMTHVFAASVADNLRLGRPSASEPECLAVLDRVGLRPWADGLAEGLSTRLGAGGVPMSAGERQRLGLARALLAGPPLLLLDEPTAHLDPTLGHQVLTELLGAAGDSSALVVSHDPAIAGYVDSVVALDGGRVTGISRGCRPVSLGLRD
ncbi:MAG: thiol reductant ABC exporter subunit CydC [Acidimicrobiales bacterium]